MSQLKLFKSINELLGKYNHQKPFSATAIRMLQLPMYGTTGEISHQNLPTIRIHCSTFVENDYFPLLELMYKHNKNQESPFDPTIFCKILYLA